MHEHHADLSPCLIPGEFARVREVGGVGGAGPAMPSAGGPAPLSDQQRSEVEDAVEAFDLEAGVGTFKLSEHTPGVGLEGSPAYVTAAVDRIDELATGGATRDEISNFVNDRFETEGHFGGVSERDQQASRDRLINALTNAVGAS